jgi:hypothetical protein
MRITVHLGQARERWSKERDKFCDQQNRLFADAPVTEEALDGRRAAGETNFGEALGFCVRRLTEERAYDLEDLAAALKDSQTGDALDELRRFLELRPEFMPAPFN